MTMTINKFCQNRVKPKLLRDVKTEALLVFIRTSLEDFFAKIQKEETSLILGSKENSQLITSELKKLLNNLEETVVSSSYLRTLISCASKNKSLVPLAKKEEPLMVYYDSLVKSLEKQLSKGQQWMPELIVISLLSEWIIEEEKSIFLYPFLKEVNYLELIEIYDKSKVNLEEEKKQIIMQMYRISSTLILNLKNSTYKINTKRKSKKRR